MQGTIPDSRQTQRGRILGLLVSARGSWVGLPEILDLHISQFGARIKELRALGFDISNRMETVDGEKRSWYRLVPGPTHANELPERLPVSAPVLQDSQATLFDLAVRHRDDG